MAQRVVDRHARAHERPRFLGRQCIRKRREGFRPCEHVLGIAAIEIDARDLAIDAHGEVPALALCADETMAAMPADAHALPWPPCSHVVADGIDVARDFMPWHPRILQPRPETFFDKHIAVAHAARLDFHAHVPSVGLRDIALDHFPVSMGCAYLRCLHCGTSSWLLFVTHAPAVRAWACVSRDTRSITIHFEDRFGKGLRRFLGQIVPDAARDHPVRIGARKFLGIRTGVRVRRPKCWTPPRAGEQAERQLRLTEHR